MANFFKATAWVMETPKAYGAFHLIFTLVGLSVVVGAAYFLRKLNDKKNRILLLCVGVFLIITEIYKQMFYYYVIGNGSYQWWIFPFQMCSIPMYLCVFCACCKNERVNKWVYDFMFAFNTFGGLLAFIEPSGINHPYITLTLHAYIWHMTLVFLGIYLYLSKRACTDKKGYFKGLIFLGISVAIAQFINVVSKGIDGINMFFISPYNANNIIVFKDIYIKYGWVVNMFLYVLALILAGAIVYYLGYMFRYLAARRKKKEQ